jgi:hypothetical protein
MFHPSKGGLGLVKKKLLNDLNIKLTNLQHLMPI